MTPSDTDKGLINFFLRHRVIAQLLMCLMLFSGIWGIVKLNTQFLPNFNINFIRVSIPWQGANASDVQRNLIVPLEQELHGLDHVKKIESTARQSSGSILIEFRAHTDMSTALNDVKERVDRVRDFPEDAEKPRVYLIERHEPIARVLIYGPDNMDTLRHIAQNFEAQLLARGIAKISLFGLPDEELSIQISSQQLHRLNLSLPLIAKRIDQQSQDIPSGVAGKNDAAKELRSLQKKRSATDLLNTPIITDNKGQQLTLNDISHVTRRPLPDATLLYFQGKPAVELFLQRTQHENALTNADILKAWLKDITPTLGPHLKIKVYQQHWRYIHERITLLMKNGLTGLAFILLILFVFLNGRVAFWVAFGIPTAFMATLGILVLFGGSINMVSLFAMIMTLGIVVDDTIVVSEDALVQWHNNKTPLKSASLGAHNMLVPVMAASLTTIAAFIPLMAVSDIMGQILFEIPLVVVCVIIASLVECFLVLPNHLRGSLEKSKHREHRFHQWFNRGFFHFRDHRFRRWVNRAIQYKWATTALGISCFILAIALVAGGRLPFTFFPSPETNTLQFNVAFAAGTPRNQVKDFLFQSENKLKSLDKTWKKQGKSDHTVIDTITAISGETVDQQQQNDYGENYGHLKVELTPPDERRMSSQAIIKAWQAAIQTPPNLEQLSISAPRGGPPGKDIDVVLSNDNALQLKDASIALQNALSQYTGVNSIKDNMPYGREQWLYELKPKALAEKLTTDDVGRQLQAAYSSLLIQTFTQGQDEIEMRISLPDAEKDSLQSIAHFPIMLPSGKTEPLNSVVNFKAQKGIDILRHSANKLSAHITAEINPEMANANNIRQNLLTTVLPKIAEQYDVSFKLEGKAEEQQNTLHDMLIGMISALFLIYVILAIVFRSYIWPLLVMAIIPLGLSGAIFGHWLLGFNLTLLSLFGLFGLAGIVVNDSIILVAAYKKLKEAGHVGREALVDAVVSRFRHVLLTSLTTIAGLTPLLFETSVQAQFLIPMAVSIVFGLMLTTLLILFVLPSLLAIYERI